MPQALFIMGPTAAGKTALALEIASRYSVEIISVDSALVYKGMDIGTAKPSPDVLERYPHHLIDIRDPADCYSVGNFRQDALCLMTEITARGNLPMLVGGTMLYFNALQQGLADLPPADIDIRARLDAKVKQRGSGYLYAYLADVDPVGANRIHRHDYQRLQRALEIYEITGKTLTELTTGTNRVLSHQVVKIILSPFSRATLHQRIAARYHKMIANGFIDEVNTLFKRDDCHADLPAIRAVGYRQVWSYLLGEYDKGTMIEKAIIATRQMAKRQLTWLKGHIDGAWFDSGVDLPIKQINLFLTGKLSNEHRGSRV